MSRITEISPEAAVGKAKDLLDAVKTRMGMVPNMTRAMANSPAVLESYLQFSSAISKGHLSAKTREQIALAIAEANGCDYCLAAHTAIGGMTGLTGEQILDSRRGSAVDPKINAAIRFALKILETRGGVADADLVEIRDAGFDDAAIAEVVATVSLDFFTNAFNRMAQTDIDFPKVPALNS